ncbi:hypothetical protein JYT10_00380 [Beggiatoa alba]|nr:hypothetical protein [Beggiatoa alba]
MNYGGVFYYIKRFFLSLVSAFAIAMITTILLFVAALFLFDGMENSTLRTMFLISFLIGIPLSMKYLKS